MNDKFVLDSETMRELEGISAKIEQLGVFIDVLKKVAWNADDIPEAELNEKIICLIETLATLVSIHDKELVNIIGKITPMDKKHDSDHRSV